MIGRVSSLLYLMLVIDLDPPLASYVSWLPSTNPRGLRQPETAPGNLQSPSTAGLALANTL